MRRIHYKFELDFVDAENVFHSFSSRICGMLKNARKSYMAGNQAESDWYERHSKYLEELIKKMCYTVDHERKMVCFDYTVDGIDSQNICDVVRREKLDSFEEIMEEMIGKNNKERIESYKKLQKDVDDLIERMYKDVEIFEDDE